MNFLQEGRKILEDESTSRSIMIGENVKFNRKTKQRRIDLIDLSC